MCDYVVLHVPVKEKKTVLGIEHYQTLQKRPLVNFKHELN